MVKLSWVQTCTFSFGPATGVQLPGVTVTLVPPTVTVGGGVTVTVVPAEEVPDTLKPDAATVVA